MPKSFYTLEQIEQWQKNLKEIAQLPRTSFTKKQVVEALIDSIEAALRNRSYQEVADNLNETGFDITAGSLKSYVTQYRRSHSKSSRRRRTPKKLASDKSKAQVSPAKQTVNSQRKRAKNTAAKSTRKAVSARK